MCGWLYACMCMSCVRVCVLQIEANNKKAAIEEHRENSNKKHAPFTLQYVYSLH